MIISQATTTLTPAATIASGDRGVVPLTAWSTHEEGLV